MTAKIQKKFHAEIQREQILNLQRDKSGGQLSDANMAAHRDTQQAIHELAQKLLAHGQSGGGLGQDAERIIQEKILIENELKSLSKALDDTKREIAGLRFSIAGDNRIKSMNNQLDAINAEAEDATNKILSAAEIIDENLKGLLKNASDDDETSILENLSEEVIKIFEACNFQDLTGQRITKVVDALKYVETRVDSMIKGLGGDESAFAALVEPDDSEETALFGPQSAGEGNSQEEIDALFD